MLVCLAKQSKLSFACISLAERDLQAQMAEMHWLKCKAQAKESAARADCEISTRSANAAQHQLRQSAVEITTMQQQQQRFLVPFSLNSRTCILF